MRPAGADKTASISVPTTSTTLAGDQVSPPVGAGVETQPTLPFTVQTPWANGVAINALHTCNGGNVAPSITWFGAPADAVEMALVVVDTDANFVHWVISGLDPTNPEIPEGNVPVGAIEATNDFGKVGWDGPCPPPGAPHHYEFTLYALDQATELPTGTPAKDLIAFIKNTQIDSAQVVGVYQAPVSSVSTASTVPTVSS